MMDREFFEARLYEGEELLDFFGDENFGLMSFTDGTRRLFRAWVRRGSRYLTIHKMEFESVLSAATEGEEKRWSQYVQRALRELFD